MSSNYFYSKSTGLYISLKPLKIDSTVKKTALDLDIMFDWDDEGHINYIDFENSKKILQGLNAQMLSPKEYWLVYKDALAENNTEALNSLTSNKFCEWLDRIYIKDKGFIDHPNSDFTGDLINFEEPLGRPAWFNPENNINYDTGSPISVKKFKQKKESSWKYWSPDFNATDCPYLAPIRGYVTSVGMPSYDLGIPVDSKQPKQMVRPCFKQMPKSYISEDILKEFKELNEIYTYTKTNLANPDILKLVESKASLLENFISKNHDLFFKNQATEVIEKREVLVNLRGLLNAIRFPTQLRSDSSYEGFMAFIENRALCLVTALANHSNIVFVMGHKNPDTDTVVSSLFEAYRNHLLDHNSIYIPIIQSHAVPAECVKLLGEEISSKLISFDHTLYQKAKSAGLCRWISTDQNREPEVQKFFVSIVDHHQFCETALNQDIPKTHEMVGSTACLVSLKFLGSNLQIDREMARILLGATLMDTENKTPFKMTVKDTLVMDLLQKVSQVTDTDKLYADLMSAMLSTDDVEFLFSRDYKEDWGFGFAVLKVKNFMDGNGNVLKPYIIEESLKLAEQNNQLKNFPLTLVRITDYLEDNKTVNRERIYPVINPTLKSEFKNALFDLISTVIKFNYPETKIHITNEYLESWGTGLQLSRKHTAPILEPVVSAFNKYFYSKSINKWVSRDFERKTQKNVKAFADLGIELSTDSEGRINYITYKEVQKLGYSILSLSDYWKVLSEARVVHDDALISSMTGSNYVEFLDSLILNKTQLMNHRQPISGEVPLASPGLFDPAEISECGFPAKMQKPSEYGNKNLWRYWAPDNDFCVITRSFIFLLNQPCLDCKFHEDDSLPNLGIRACYDSVVLPEVSAHINGDALEVVIIQDESKRVFKWNRSNFLTE